MVFNKHFELKGKHAILSPSGYHWINYDEKKMKQVYLNKLAVEKGTVLHALAADMITHGVKASRSKETFNMYVNDAIGYKMTPELSLKYSDNCFGTADAISFRDNMLRIHDLKTGATPAHMEQLECYAALFCLEYGVKPGDISMELRIYQNGEVVVHNPDPDDISFIMNTIKKLDKVINRINNQNDLEE